MFSLTVSRFRLPLLTLVVAALVASPSFSAVSVAVAVGHDQVAVGRAGGVGQLDAVAGLVHGGLDADAGAVDVVDHVLDRLGSATDRPWPWLPLRSVRSSVPNWPSPCPPFRLRSRLLFRPASSGPPVIVLPTAVVFRPRSSAACELFRSLTENVPLPVVKIGQLNRLAVGGNAGLELARGGGVERVQNILQGRHRRCRPTARRSRRPTSRQCRWC